MCIVTMTFVQGQHKVTYFLWVIYPVKWLLITLTMLSCIFVITYYIFKCLNTTMSSASVICCRSVFPQHAAPSCHGHCITGFSKTQDCPGYIESIWCVMCWSYVGCHGLMQYISAACLSFAVYNKRWVNQFFFYYGYNKDNPNLSLI